MIDHRCAKPYCGMVSPTRLSGERHADERQSGHGYSP